MVFAKPMGYPETKLKKHNQNKAEKRKAGRAGQEKAKGHELRLRFFKIFQ